MRTRGTNGRRYGATGSRTAAGAGRNRGRRANANAGTAGNGPSPQKPDVARAKTQAREAKLIKSPQLGRARTAGRAKLAAKRAAAAPKAAEARSSVAKAVASKTGSTPTQRVRSGLGAKSQAGTRSQTRRSVSSGATRTRTVTDRSKLAVDTKKTRPAIKAATRAASKAASIAKKGPNTVSKMHTKLTTKPKGNKR